MKKEVWIHSRSLTSYFLDGEIGYYGEGECGFFMEGCYLIYKDACPKRRKLWQTDSLRALPCSHCFDLGSLSSCKEIDTSMVEKISRREQIYLIGLKPLESSGFNYQAS